MSYTVETAGVRMAKCFSFSLGLLGAAALRTSRFELLNLKIYQLTGKNIRNQRVKNKPMPKPITPNPKNSNKTGWLKTKVIIWEIKEDEVMGSVWAKAVEVKSSKVEIAKRITGCFRAP